MLGKQYRRCRNRFGRMRHPLFPVGFNMLIRLAPHRRLFNLAGFLACLTLVVAAYYLQFVDGLEPCPLCIFQRVALMVLGGVFLLAALQNPWGMGRYAYGVALGLVATLGGAISARHVWLQSLPADQVPDCGPGLNYLLDTFPLMDVIAIALRGSGECADVDIVLGLSIPLWTLIAFVGLGVAGVLVNLAGSPR